ncbi:MAG: NUDIX hydrolase [Promethearchaeota archaeon]
MNIPPVKPRLASSIILIRGFRPNIEIFMIKRHENLKFLGGFHAFPGGKQEKDDFSCKHSNINFSEDVKIFFKLENEKFDLNQIETLYVTAIRELFEEIGILLAYNEKKCIINLKNEENLQKFSRLRKELLENKISFSKLIDQENLTLACDKLTPLRHFITPEFSAIRYDTYFFTAELPINQFPMEINSEIEDSIWISPKLAIKKFNKKEILLIPPQLVCLTDLKKLNRRRK